MSPCLFRNNVIACAKHFVGDGGTEKGVNEGNTLLPYEDLERVHMAPYLNCLSQGVCTVMASYSRWNGRRLHSDRFLLTEVLKEKLKFQVTTKSFNKSKDLWIVFYHSCRSRNRRSSSFFSQLYLLPDRGNSAVWLCIVTLAGGAIMTGFIDAGVHNF